MNIRNPRNKKKYYVDTRWVNDAGVAGLACVGKSGRLALARSTLTLFQLLDLPERLRSARLTISSERARPVSGCRQYQR